jgi:hypothetical protein
MSSSGESEREDNGSESSGSGEDSDGGIGALEAELERLSTLVGMILTQLEATETQLATLQPHIEDLHVNQLGDLPFLETSPFRHETFRVQPPGFPGVELDQRYPFKDICGALRKYVIRGGSVADDGTITLDAPLKKLFKTRTNKTTFLELMGMLRRVLV